MRYTNEQIMDHMSQLIRVGFVTARQPEKHRVQVELRDTVTNPLVTKWLPVLCPCASGDLHYDLPDIGDQVLCLFLSYGLEQGFVVGSMYGKQTPPVSDAEKFHRKFKDGATIEYDRATHALTANIPGTAKIVCTGTLTLDAPHILLHGALTNTAQDGGPGKATFSGGVEILNGGLNAVAGDVVASGVSLAGHTTTGVQPGTGTSDLPTGGASGLPVGPMPMTDAVVDANYEQLRQQVEQSDKPEEKLLLCVPEIAAAMVEQQDRPEDREGWLLLRRLLRRWFAGVECDDALKSPDVVWVDLDWVLQYRRAQLAYNTIKTEDGLLTVKAKNNLTAVLKADGKLLPQGRCEFNYITDDHRQWNGRYAQQYTVFRYGISENEIPENFIDDDGDIGDVEFQHGDMIQPDGLTAAMGGFQIRAFVAGYTEPLQTGGHRIAINKIGIIVWDSFNFKGKANLRYWRCSPPEFALMQIPGSMELTNDHFNAFRRNNHRGQDFLVLSRMRILDILPEYTYETGI